MTKFAMKQIILTLGTRLVDRHIQFQVVTLLCLVCLWVLFRVVDTSLKLSCRIDVPSIQVLRVDLCGFFTVIYNLKIVSIIEFLNVLIWFDIFELPETQFVMTDTQ